TLVFMTVTSRFSLLECYCKPKPDIVREPSIG
ncbi:MAG: hypothetical protein ACI8R0_000582, partial [Alteromonadales bacterium]